MKKIIITGATGYLGFALIKHAAKQAEVVGLARNPASIANDCNAIAADITNRSKLIEIIAAEKPDAIIHCAAVNPGGSADDMLAVNEHGSKHVAEAARRVDCRLVAVSSDTVFSGENAPYRDSASASPLALNDYAVTKAKGESSIAATLPAAAVVRTSLIYGLDRIDRGTEGFMQRLAAGETLKLFTDVIRQPVHDAELSAALTALALHHVGESGFINVAGNEALSRYEFGKRMLNYWNADYNNQLEAVSGQGIDGLPMDVRLQLDRAAALGLATSGVSQVLQKQV